MTGEGVTNENLQAELPDAIRDFFDKGKIFEATLGEALAQICYNENTYISERLMDLVRKQRSYYEVKGALLDLIITVCYEFGH